MDVSYPFLLEVYDDYESQRLSKSDFIEVLRLVESYVFRRAICGVPTNSLNKTFANLSKEIDKDNYLESVRATFLLKDAYKRLPSDEEFTRELVVKDVYNFRNRNYLLRKLENFNRKEIVDIEAYTIEHIMPQNNNLSLEWRKNLGDDWEEVHKIYLHTLGNLTLTRYNSLEASNLWRLTPVVGSHGLIGHNPIYSETRAITWLFHALLTLYSRSVFPFTLL